MTKNCAVVAGRGLTNHLLGRKVKKHMNTPSRFGHLSDEQIQQLIKDMIDQGQTRDNSQAFREVSNEFERRTKKASKRSGIFRDEETGSD